MLELIKQGFASLKNGRYQKLIVSDQFIDAWIFRKSEDYGVAIPYEGETIYENFSKVLLQSEKMNLDGGSKLVLSLTCSAELLRNEFAVIATQFVELGEKNQNRVEVTNRPRDWWERWSNLIGNTFIERNPYDVIAEMLSFEYLLEQGENPIWRGPLGGSQDIMAQNGPVEVKSTTKKYDAVISINSQFQLYQEEGYMRLFFVRMEKSIKGLSVEDMFRRLSSKGADLLMLRENIEKSGIHEGSGLWKEKYDILEKRIYKVDEKFPTINSNSFKENKIPDGVLKIIYEIDLDSIRYEIW